MDSNSASANTGANGTGRPRQPPKGEVDDTADDATDRAEPNPKPDPQPDLDKAAERLESVHQRLDANHERLTEPCRVARAGGRDVQVVPSRSDAKS